MSGPISGGGGAAAKIAMQQLQQMQNTQPQQLETQVGQKAGGTSFQQTMQTQQTQQTQKPNEIQQANKTNKSRSIRDIAHTQRPQSSQKVNATKKTESTHLNKVKTDKKTGGLTKLMEGMTNRKKDLDKLIQSALKGQSFNQKELLVLQYKVSTFSMEMDLTSKVVEKSTGGLKQAMNTQV